MRDAKERNSKRYAPMAKKKSAKKKRVNAAAKAPRKKAVKSPAKKSKISSRKKRTSRPRAYVARVTSGSEASSLDPKGRLINENEVEATPRTQIGELAGDLQGLSREEVYDSESVVELSEEGQDLEAELIEGIEEAPDPDQDEVHVHTAQQKEVPDYKDRNRI